jgi:hypothetical protein
MRRRKARRGPHAPAHGLFASEKVYVLNGQAAPSALIET